MFNLIGTVMANFAHAEWGAARHRSGILGLFAEASRAFVGTTSWPFLVDRTGRWNRRRIESLLRQYGIASWGWGQWRNQIYFRVKNRQAAWAQHILLENGVPVQGHRFRGKVATQNGTADGTISNSHAKRKTESSLVSQDPLAAIDSLLDRLARLEL